MWDRIERLSQPAVEPLSLADVKGHAHIDASDETAPTPIRGWASPTASCARPRLAASFKSPAQPAANIARSPSLSTRSGDLADRADKGSVPQTTPSFEAAF
jgi:hypothetical protein